MLSYGFSIIIFLPLFVISILKPNIQRISRNANTARHIYPKPKKTYGMILTNNRELYEKLRIFRHHGIIRESLDNGSWYYEINDLGHNFRITDFQCALGLSQMNKLDSFIQRRRQIAAKYNQAFAEVAEIITPLEKENVRAVYHIYVIQLHLEKLKAGRKEIFEALTPSLTDLVEQIKKHLDFYQTHVIHEHLPPDGKGAKNIFLCGGGANLKGLTDFLSSELKIQVNLGNPWINILPEPLKEVPELPFQESLRYTTALGLALRGI